MPTQNRVVAAGGMSGGQISTGDGAATQAGPWRDGVRVVVAPSRSAAMPGRCVRCNLAATRIIQRKLPFPKTNGMMPTKFGRMASGMAYLIEAERLHFSFGQCPAHSRFTPHVVGMICGLLGTVALLTAPILMMSKRLFTMGLLLLIACGVLMTITIIAALRTPRITKADEGFVWIAGCGRAFLDSLPAWRMPKVREMRR